MPIRPWKFINPVKSIIGIHKATDKTVDNSNSRTRTQAIQPKYRWITDPAFLTKGAIANSRNLARQGFKPIYSPPVAQNSVLRLQASE